MRIPAAAALLFSLLTGTAVVADDPVRLPSPGGRLVVTFELKTFGDARCASYRVDFDGRQIVMPSRLRLELGGGGPTGGMSVVGCRRSEHDGTWVPVCGERSSVRDRYHQVVVDLREDRKPHRRLQLTFRAYDEGIAFCYTVPSRPEAKTARIAAEHSEFRFRGDHLAWMTYSGQGSYRKLPLSEMRGRCERPLVVEAGDGAYVAVAEAKLVDYARMRLSPIDGVPHGIVTELDGAVEASLPFTTPWRVVMVAESPGRLLESNPIVLNLNDPCAIDDTSWIQPGKVIREVTLTTGGGMACVDFAVKHGLQFVEYDAGWYGHEYDETADATTIDVDPRRSKGPLDLHRVIRYAAERGVGIILYVNRRALEKQLDGILPLYREWGVRGIKFGFVNVGSQKWTAWLHGAIRRCAEHRLMVDVHDEYRPTGYSRTYPNLMTVEGIRGDEARPANDVTLAYVFTRMIAGRADNTVCWTDPRVRENASHAYQLAKPVCIFSPWQFLFWYDRPAAIEETPELDFFRELPTTWDDTRVIRGSIGEYAVIARRKGDVWFVGCMNDAQPRTLAVPLEFLARDRRYLAHVYTDSPDVPTRTGVNVTRIRVERDHVLEVHLAARGGQAIRLVPTEGGPR